MHDLLSKFDDSLLFMLGFFTLIMIVILILVVGELVKTLTLSRDQERTRREIAAYVAEGSITPTEGVRLMESGRSPKETENAKDQPA